MITYFLLFLALGYHLAFDLHKQKEGKPIVHWLSALWVLVISSVSGVINSITTSVYWWQFTFLSLVIHFVFFDPIWNAFHKQRWNYHGDPNNPNRAWTDRLWSEVPGAGEILFRFIVFFLGYSVYYNWTRIVGN